MISYKCEKCKFEIEYGDNYKGINPICRNCSKVMSLIRDDRNKKGDNVRLNKKEDGDLDKLIKIMKDKIVAETIRKKILTLGEAKYYIGRYIDDFGSDSFINYLSYLIGKPEFGVNDIFLTLNQKMLNDKVKIEKRFKLKIYKPEELWNGMQNELFKHI